MAGGLPNMGLRTGGGFSTADYGGLGDMDYAALAAQAQMGGLGGLGGMPAPAPAPAPAAPAGPAGPAGPALQSASPVPVADPTQGFDPNWYLATFPDVKQSGMNPLQHYMAYGAKEGRPRNAYEAAGQMKPAQPQPGQTPAGNTLTAGDPASWAGFMDRARAQTAGMNRLPTMAPTADQIPNDPVLARAMFTGQPIPAAYLSSGTPVVAGKNGEQFAAGFNVGIGGNKPAQNLGMGMF